MVVCYQQRQSYLETQSMVLHAAVNQWENQSNQENKYHFVNLSITLNFTIGQTQIKSTLNEKFNNFIEYYCCDHGFQR